ncbi:hypothetical protein GCM10009826_46010 [Humibacillus xanthopallidus]
MPDHWIPQTALLVAFVFALFFPALVLPVGSLPAARERDCRLELPTVMGRRTMNLERASASRLLIPGRGSTLDVLVIRSGWRVVIVTATGSGPSSSLAPCLRTLWRDTVRNGSRVSAWARGCLVIALWSVGALVVMGLVGDAAGVL